MSSTTPARQSGAAAVKATSAETVLITDVVTRDVRFHTSKGKHGSDAMSPDPEYSCVYMVLLTTERGLEGHGFTFSIGRGNEIMQLAAETLKHKLIGRSLKEITNSKTEGGRKYGFATLWRDLCYGSQMKWCGPEKGPVHQAAAGIINAVWDLWAKFEGKPVWRLIADMPSEQLVGCLDFRYVMDMITPVEALEILERESAGIQDRIKEMQEVGYPAYTTATGWLGYTDKQVLEKVAVAKAEGFTAFKMKCGVSIEDDVRRAKFMREAIGPDMYLMMDANCVWEVQQSVDWMQHLLPFNPYWIEEPTSPDDILGHGTIQRALTKAYKETWKAKGHVECNVATGEQMSNRILHKQMLQNNSYNILQTDIVRLGGLSEFMVVALMAIKNKKKICLHAGGVGLCNYAAHVCILDYIKFSGSLGLEGKMTEYVDHLQEHFVHDLVMKNGRYMAPKDNGFGVEMWPESLDYFQYPSGEYWSKKVPNHFYKTYDGVACPPKQIPDTSDPVGAQPTLARQLS